MVFMIILHLSFLVGRASFARNPDVVALATAGRCRHSPVMNSDVAWLVRLLAACDAAAYVTNASCAALASLLLGAGANSCPLAVTHSRVAGVGVLTRLAQLTIRNGAEGKRGVAFRQLSAWPRPARSTFHGVSDQIACEVGGKSTGAPEESARGVGELKIPPSARVTRSLCYLYLLKQEAWVEAEILRHENVSPFDRRPPLGEPPTRQLTTTTGKRSRPRGNNAS